jgi:hypothetical protein
MSHPASIFPPAAPSGVSDGWLTPKRYNRMNSDHPETAEVTDADLVQHIQTFIARAATGPSAVRGRGNKGAGKAAREFLGVMPLGTRKAQVSETSMQR